MHGSQPDAFVVCHEVGRQTIEAFPDFPVPTIEELIKLTITTGRVTNPNIRCVGVSLNTSSLSGEEREAVLMSTADEIGLPCVDPVATGVTPLVDYVSQIFGSTAS